MIIYTPLGFSEYKNYENNVKIQMRAGDGLYAENIQIGNRYLTSEVLCSLSCQPFTGSNDKQRSTYRTVVRVKHWPMASIRLTTIKSHVVERVIHLPFLELEISHRKKEKKNCVIF